MAYLERNILFLEEVKRNLALQNLTLQRGKVIAETPNTRFVEIGSYESALRGSQLHLGLKESKNPALNPSLMNMQLRIPAELAFMEHLARKLPYLLPELPACYARLLGQDSSLLGIVMEDFTHGGQLESKRDIWQTPMIERIFIRNSLDSDYVENMAIFINGQRKLIDFYPMFEMGKEHLNRRMMKQAIVEKNLHLYTLQIDYEL